MCRTALLFVGILCVRRRAMWGLWKAWRVGWSGGWGWDAEAVKGRRVCEGRNAGLMWLVCEEGGSGMVVGCGCVFLLNELIRNM